MRGMGFSVLLGVGLRAEPWESSRASRACIGSQMGYLLPGS